MDFTKYTLRTTLSDGSESSNTKLCLGYFCLCSKGSDYGDTKLYDIYFRTFKEGNTFYVNYKGALRAARIIGIKYGNDWHWGYGSPSYRENDCLICYTIAGIGEVGIMNGLASYNTIEDFKNGNKSRQTTLVTGRDMLDKIKNDLKGVAEVWYGAEYGSMCIYQWTWDGTKSVKNSISNYNLSFDGTKFILAISAPLQGAFPSKELCETANEIKVVEF